MITSTNELMENGSHLGRGGGGRGIIGIYLGINWIDSNLGVLFFRYVYIYIYIYTDMVNRIDGK